MKRLSQNPKRSLIPLVAAAALAMGSMAALACGDSITNLTLQRLAREALSDHPAQAQSAVTALREAGPAGLDALFKLHAASLFPQPAPNGPPAAPEAQEPSRAWMARLSRAMDQVGQQRDCLHSQLYWHTDLNRAVAAARAEGKPILSLRLLGKLDEEFSCANSRFFRSALYANAEVSKALRDRFVLHWESVRPVPRLTIDFGDGRKLERTITGNSIHYVLSPDGFPVDALPGLYGPKAFLAALDRAAKATLHCRALPEAERASFLQAWHRESLAAMDQEWVRDAGLAGLTLPRAELTGEGWARLAALHAGDAKLDPASRKLVAAKMPVDAEAAMKRAFSKTRVEDPLLKAMGEFERSMAEDTVRNEYLFHSAIRRWFVDGDVATRDVRVLNEKVYTALFLTPSSDPWLGLKPAGVYSALDGDGVVVATQ